jgi:iron complex outermembrane receptor protein
LENETGVAKRSFGVGSSRPVIRGFDGDRVLVLQDGVRGGSVGSQSGDHGEPIDPLGAERIESRQRSGNASLRLERARRRRQRHRQ